MGGEGSDSGSQPERVVRPTLRCLLEDLADDVGPEVLRVAVRSAVADIAEDPNFLFPCALTEIQHPVLEKANLLATDSAAVREQIQAITDRHVVKVKTGSRRGALWEDESGEWWLLGAGLRKDDGPGDFYRELSRFTGKNSADIAPTEADARYRALERAYLAECAADRGAHEMVLAGVFEAAKHTGSPIEVTVFGAVVSIRIDLDDDVLAVLEMSWEFDRFDQQDRFPYDVLAMAPGLESTDLWEYLPPRKDADSPHTWFTYVTRDWVEQLATSVELDDLIDEAGWTPPNPSSDGSEHYSHWAPGRIVTLAYVTGIEIVGLCGARVVAHRDYERFPVCPKCEENLALLRSLRQSE